MSEIYRRKGKHYARTATGGCNKCVFGCNKMGLCISGKQPSFAYRASSATPCSGQSGPAWEEVKETKSTQKPKEPKTMTKEPKTMTKEPKTMPTTKKPGTSHGKPTAKGLRVEKKPTAAKVSKYPAAREAVTYGVTITGKTTKESIVGMLELTIEIHNGTLKDLATTGTKLDRALVDLKEAKKRIKELEATK